MMRPVLGVELGANASKTSSLLNSLATNRALIPVLSVVQMPMCRHSLLPESSLQIYSLILCRLLSVWPPSPFTSPHCQQQGPAFHLHLRDRRGTPQASSLPDTVTPATVIFRTSICESSPRECFACGGTSSVIGSAARLVSVEDLE